VLYPSGNWFDYPDMAFTNANLFVTFNMFKGDTSHPLVDAAWRPAYWRVEHRAACYAPT
jgi:hypothetical protein